LELADGLAVHGVAYVLELGVEGLSRRPYCEQAASYTVELLVDQDVEGW
jgi:hypothetical protein